MAETKTEKMTYVKAVEYAIAHIENTEETSEVVEKLIALLASLNKKGSAERKPTKVQLENAKVLEQIIEEMEIGKKYTISEMIKNFEFLNGCTPSKVTGIIKPALEKNIHREEIKNKAYFSLI